MTSNSVIGRCNRLVLWSLLWWSCQAGQPLRAQAPVAEKALDELEIHSVTLGENQISWHPNEVNLGASPRAVTISFFPRGNHPPPPTRVRYRLDGYNRDWVDGPGFMFVAVRFYNAGGDQIQQKQFRVEGESAGWRGSPEASLLTHRRETVTAPPGAASVRIMLSSAGPPAAVGVYVMADLVVSNVNEGGPARLLMQSPLSAPADGLNERSPVNWLRGGAHPSMAKIISVGENPSKRAFAIFDDDTRSHAEWHNADAADPAVRPGDKLLVEWSEFYSIGTGDVTAAHFPTLAEGRYLFHVADFDIYGRRSGVEAAISVVVPAPWWRRPTSGLAAGALLLAATVGSGRFLSWRRMQREVVRLKYQQALVQERLRIAQDIHDDLGARATEISMVSALAKTRPNLPSAVTEDFDQISDLCRNLITALYGTVWAVNPENDNLDALGDYLCQLANRLCRQARIACRLQVSPLPREIELSSQNRHNLAMCVTEAIHNSIKHAHAAELTLKIGFAAGFLDILVQDQGRGFDERNKAGNGLANMKRRLAGMNGACSVTSAPGRGTSVHLRMPVHPPSANGGPPVQA